MGVPKFFRYISERYPCLSELVRMHQVSFATKAVGLKCRKSRRTMAT